jgi:xanthine/CO dehydrogenase XdhC/CoxF family maturation factor
MADRVILSRPEEVASHVTITSRTLTLLMSHNYSHDLALLRFLLASPAHYIGVMGPRKRTERMLSELNEDTYRLEESDLARLYSPVGLDIGANTSAEIAVSIIAEMRAMLDARRGGLLRERRGSIHGGASDGEHVSLIAEEAVSAAVA